MAYLIQTADPRQYNPATTAAKIPGTQSSRTAVAGDAQKYLGNRVYPTVEDLDDAVADAWLAVIQNKEDIRALCAFDWITEIGKIKWTWYQ